MNIDKHLEEGAGRNTLGAGSTNQERQVQSRDWLDHLGGAGASVQGLVEPCFGAGASVWGLVEPPDPETQPSSTPGRHNVPKTIPKRTHYKNSAPQLPRPPKRFPNDTTTTVPPKINPPVPTFVKTIQDCTHPNNWATGSCWKDIENDFWTRQLGQDTCWAGGEMRFFL